MKIVEFFSLISDLGFPVDDFAVFGSGPMAVRNIREAGDLDLLVREELWQKLVKEGHRVIDEDFVDDFPGGYATSHHREFIKIGGNVEIFRKWPLLPDTADELIDNADIFDDVRFVKLDKLMEFKTAYKRFKDEDDIKLIKEYLSKK